MATELVIKSWCDVCLEAGENTPGETLTVAAGVVPAFDIEVCPAHAKPLADAVAVLAPLGRGVGKGVPSVPASPNKTADYALPSPGACPECGHAAPSLGAMRGHLRGKHGKSLADVGLVENRHACPECGSGYPNKQGLAAHRRIAHPDTYEKAS